MGCAASSHAAAEAEGFFPPPVEIKDSPPEKASTAGTGTPQQQQQQEQHQPEQQQPVAPPSLAGSSAASSPPVKKKKKKEEYKPPAPPIETDEPPKAKTSLSSAPPTSTSSEQLQDSGQLSETSAPEVSNSKKSSSSSLPQEQPTSSNKPTSDKSPLRKSKTKTPYVPPAPITATVAAAAAAAEEQVPAAAAAVRKSGTSSKSQTKSKKSSSPSGAAVTTATSSFSADDARKIAAQPNTSDEQSLSDGSLSGADLLNAPEAAIKSFQENPDESSEEESMAESNKSPIMYDSVNVHETPQPSSESGMRFDELYRLKGVLGTGAFSTVREGFHRTGSDISYAVKCINRKKLSEEDEAALLEEVGILKSMKHAHIIRLYDFFIEPSTYYLVMERMRGGELFDRIVAKAYYNEKEARDTCKMLLEAVCFCHENHVAHRDLKPENLLLLSENDDTSVKIADFGFAKKVYERNSLTTQCGTPGYVAPEILEGTAYDERADMWSVGVILYILLGGYPPFIESTQRDLFRKIRRGEYEFHEEYWGTVSGEAKELISALLTVDVNDRLTADEALENAWITVDDEKLVGRDLGINLQKLQNFNAKRKFRAVVSTIMAVNKLNCLKEALFVPMVDTTVKLVDDLEKGSAHVSATRG